MKKILVTLFVVLAVAGIAIGLRAATVNSATDLSDVKVTAYLGSTQLISMSGADCVSVYMVLPTDVKNRIVDEWSKFNRIAREQGTYAGVKYSIKQDMTFSCNGYKVVATNLTPEMIQRIISLSE